MNPNKQDRIPAAFPQQFTKADLAATLALEYGKYARAVFEHSMPGQGQREEDLRNRALGARNAVAAVAKVLGITIPAGEINDRYVQECERRIAAMSGEEM